jgi:predicted Zn-dependent peptidase
MMKRLLGLIVCATVGVLVGVSSCTSKAAKELGIKLDLQEHSLSNGLKIVLVPDHTVPVVSYQTWVRVGSVDEMPGSTGLSHLFEHLMFKGTPKYGPKQFFEQLEAKGAEVNAFTTRDYTVFYENMTPALLEKAIDMEADRLQHLSVTDEMLNLEKQVVLEERRLRTDNQPAGKLQEALWMLAFKRHSYQWPVIGYPEDIVSVSLERVREFFEKHYHASNATVVVVGDFDPARTLGLIRKAYGELPKRTRPKRDIRDEPEQREERRLNLYDPIASERFAQAYHVTSADQDDSFALDVLANILFEGTSSRAYQKLVEEKDVAIGINGSAYTPTYPGLFIISGTMKGSVPASEAEQLLDQLIREAQDMGVTEDEVKVAVKQLTVQLVDSVRTPYGLGQLIGTVQTVFGDPYRFAEDVAKYTRVKPSDVKRVANQYLIPNNRSVVTLLPESRRPKEGR